MTSSAVNRRIRNVSLIGAGILTAGVVIITSQSTPTVAASTDASASSAPATPSTPGATALTPTPVQPTTAPPTPTPTSAPSTPASRPTSAEPPAARQNRVLVQARVVPAQVPADSTRRWKPMTPPQKLQLQGGFKLNECAEIKGALAWEQQGFISAQRTPAVQDALAFASPAAAHDAYQGLLADMRRCQKSSRDLQAKYGLTPDATVSSTASTASGSAWSRHWTGVQGMSADGVQTNHIYAVQRGTVLVLLHFEEWQKNAAPAYDTHEDTSILDGLVRNLSSN